MFYSNKFNSFCFFIADKVFRSFYEYQSSFLYPYNFSLWGCPNKNGELCENTTEVNVNLEEVKVVKDESHTHKIMLDDKIGVVMEYPNASSITKKEEDTFKTGMNLIMSGINMIFTENETHERNSFTDKELEEFIDSLNSEQFQKIKNFYDTMPKLEHTVKYKCSTCGEDKETIMRGLNSFFG